MSVIATAVRHLLAAGVTGEALVQAIADMEASQPANDSAADRRRAWDRERKRKAKLLESGGTPVESGGTPVESGGFGGNSAEDFEDKKTPQTPIKNSYTPVSPKGDTAPTGAKRTRGSRISPDWAPPEPTDLSPEARKLAAQWPIESYRAEAEAFVNYWLGENGAKACKVNWTTTWANRVVQIHSKVMRDARFGNGPAPPNRSSDQSSYLDHLLSKQSAGAAR